MDVAVVEAEAKGGQIGMETSDNTQMIKEKEDQTLYNAIIVRNMVMLRQSVGTNKSKSTMLKKMILKVSCSWLVFILKLILAVFGS